MAATELGPAAASRLQARLADLRAADSIYDLPVGGPRTESGTPPTLVLDLADGLVLVAQPNHRKLPVATNGGVDWERVRRLQVLAIKWIP